MQVTSWELGSRSGPTKIPAARRKRKRKRRKRRRRRKKMGRRRMKRRRTKRRRKRRKRRRRRWRRPHPLVRAAAFRVLMLLRVLYSNVSGIGLGY